MEINDLKSAWNTVDAPDKNALELQNMLKENRHPVLKGLRKQLTIEITGWSAFLLCYYTMFDGDQKPLIINILLVFSILISLLHNISGYYFSKNLPQQGTLLGALKHYLNKMKWFAGISIFSRALFAIGLFVFFSYNVNFTNTKYWLLALGSILVLVQLATLTKIWRSRIKELSSDIAGLH